MKNLLMTTTFYLVFFLCSSFTLFPKKTIENQDCLDRFSNAVDNSLALGFSVLDATCVGNVVYARCLGFDADSQQCWDI